MYTNAEQRALSIWKERWIAQKKRYILLIAILGICFLAFFAALCALDFSLNALLALMVLFAVFTGLLLHEIRLLDARKRAQVHLCGSGFLVEKCAFSHQTLTRGKSARGNYATIRTERGDIQVVLDACTYARSQIGDPMLILRTAHQEALYGAAAKLD